MQSERLLGIVGGVGPEATADYYRRLIDRWRVRGPANTYPAFIVDSLNSRQALDQILSGNLDPIAELYEVSIARLAQAGAGLVIIASVMTHIVFDRVSPGAPVPLLSIVDALVSAARAGAIRRPLLLATRPTTEGQFFAGPFEAAGIDLVRPNEADRAWINEIYFEELVRGDINPETRAGLVQIIEKTKSGQGIDGVILGGTELPLILREPSYAGVPVLDSSGVHVEAAIDWLLDSSPSLPCWRHGVRFSASCRANPSLITKNSSSSRRRSCTWPASLADGGMLDNVEDLLTDVITSPALRLARCSRSSVHCRSCSAHGPARPSSGC